MNCSKIRIVALLLVIAVAEISADVVSVQPDEAYNTILEQGQWQPAQKVYELQNPSNDWVYWQASDTQGLTDCQPKAGWIAPAGTQSVVICPAAAVSMLEPGTYAESVTLDFDSRLLGDLDGDGEVNVFDLMRFSAAFGGDSRDCDFDGNGAVDIYDLVQMANNFGRHYGALSA